MFRMNPTKRARTNTRDGVNASSESDRNRVISCNVAERFRTLVEYFLTMAHVTGIHDDFQVMSDAWAMTTRVLSGSGAIETLLNDIQGSLCDGNTLPRKFKAVVIATCALAVDVCGDFEASFAHSAVAWGTLFIDQIQETSRSRSAESDCMQLMRMKMIIGRALRWEIGFNNPATSFCEILSRLRDNRQCQFCCPSSGRLSRQQTSTLQGISLLLSPRGDSSDQVALVAILFMHNPESSFTIPSPVRNDMHLIPSCLSSLFSQDAPIEGVMESLAYVHQNLDYVEYLISETFNPRDISQIKTLSTIEREYFQELSGDVVSPN